MAHDLDAVLFDMDGTLVNTELLWLIGETETAKLLGADWTPADSAECVGGPMDKVSTRIKKRSGSHLPAVEINQMLIDTMERHMRVGDVSFTPGTEELLDALVAARIPLALVSASPRLLVDVVLERLGRDHFATTIAGDEVPKSKPAPDPYWLAAQRLGAKPENCIVVEDSPTGVRSGLASGGVVVAIPHVVAIEPAPRLIIVDTLEDITPDHLHEWVREANSL